MKYTVQSGDTLENIAVKYLGDASYASVLWSVNKRTLKSGTPSLIHAGEVIEIPDQLLRETLGSVQNDVDDIFLRVEGKLYGGWISARVTRSIEAAAGSFEVSLTDVWEPDMDPWAIFPGDGVTIVIKSDTVITGWVDAVEMSHDASSHNLSIRGRDKTCDLVDCSAVNRPGEFRGKTPEQIARALCQPYGVTVKTDVDTGGVVDLFRVQPGESVFESVERLARGRQLLVTGSENGALLLTRSGSTRAGIKLEEGVNILSCSVSIDASERFSSYIVEGQSDGQGVANCAAKASANDPAMKRYRTLIIMAEEKADQAYCAQRAKWEARVRAAKAQTVSIMVPGWRYNETLWTPGKLVSLNYPTCRIFDEELLITEVELQKDDAGTMTTLTLKRPDAFLAESELTETKDILQAHKAAANAAKSKAKRASKSAV
jgi:prophage tail gpP-like protein